MGGCEKTSGKRKKLERLLTARRPTEKVGKKEDMELKSRESEGYKESPQAV